MPSMEPGYKSTNLGCCKILGAKDISEFPSTSHQMLSEHLLQAWSTQEGTYGPVLKDGWRWPETRTDTIGGTPQ